jgi:thiol-disulfide isomerase/thioredoxin
MGSTSKTFDADMKFFFRAVLVAGFVMFVLKFLVAPFVIPPDPKAPLIREYVHQIVPVQATEVRDKLVQMHGKPTMVFVYASWCSFCKQIFPSVVTLMRAKELDAFNMMFISLDSRFSALSEFVVKSEYEGLFTPYILKQSSVNTLEASLQGLGGSYNGTIPYMAFFNADGKLVAENLGVVDKQALLTNIEKAQAK